MTWCSVTFAIARLVLLGFADGTDMARAIEEHNAQMREFRALRAEFESITTTTTLDGSQTVSVRHVGGSTNVDHANKHSVHKAANQQSWTECEAACVAFDGHVAFSDHGAAARQCTSWTFIDVAHPEAELRNECVFQLDGVWEPKHVPSQFGGDHVYSGSVQREN
jgi:hypothetical protein